MELLDRNPFNNIKANDLKLEEIIDQWVEMPGSNFKKLISPKSLDPLYILGGKGSGKTHLMRYCSFDAQAFRHKSKPLCEGLREDGYIGFYFRASGLNGSRFDDLEVENAKKLRVFQYSFELYVAQLVINTLLRLEAIDERFSFSFNDKLLASIKDLFLIKKPGLSDCQNISQLLAYLESISREIDIQVNSSLFSEELDIEVLLNRGDLIFGLPKLVSVHCQELADINFIYLVDELENIGEDNQKYLNTLIRERSNNVTFRIGARKHGVFTYQTLGSGEVNREGHEFENLRLDDLFVSGANYESFAVELIFKRLIQADFLSKDDYSCISNKYEYLTQLFEDPDCHNFSHDSSKAPFSDSMKRFRGRLLSSKELEEELVDKVCRNLSFHANLIAEKAAIHLFCQRWSSPGLTHQGLLDYSEYIKSEFLDGVDAPKGKVLKKIEYYKNNYVASLLRVAHQNNFDQYLGFEQILNITKGYPRHLLTVFRHIYKNEVFNGVIPFSRSQKVSLASQRIALKESFEWFHNDCVSEGALGFDVEIALARIGELLRIEYYSDKPVECSASGFDVDLSRVNEHTKSVLKWAEQVRVIINGTPRQEKNSEKMVDKYYLNGLLCPRWGVPANRRGSISLKSDVIDVIFDKEKAHEYDYLRRSFYSRRNAPYDCSDSSSVGQMDLFTL